MENLVRSQDRREDVRVNTQVRISKELTPRVIIVTRDSLQAINQSTLRQWYEDNRLVVVDGIVSDVKPFQRFSALPGRKYKKLKLDSRISPKFLKGLKPENEIRILAKELSKAYHSLMGILDLWGYKSDLKHITARFQESRNEGLHIDAYSPFQLRRAAVTAYLNLDDEFRIWDTSYSMDELIESDEFLQKTGMSRDGLKFELGRKINKTLAKEQFPRTTISLAPGAAIIANGATVSHEIVYGRRLLAVSLCFKIKHLDDDSGSYLRTFKRLARTKEKLCVFTPY